MTILIHDVVLKRRGCHVNSENSHLSNIRDSTSDILTNAYIFHLKGNNSFIRENLYRFDNQNK